MAGRTAGTHILRFGENSVFRYLHAYDVLPGSALVTTNGVSIVLVAITDAADFTASRIAGLVWGGCGGGVRRMMRQTGRGWSSWVLGHYLAVE